MEREVMVAISVGELVDKITILEIKQQQISDPVKQRNIRAELQALRPVFLQLSAAAPDGTDALIDRLRVTNRTLWWIEDELRSLEQDQNFGTEFIRLARAVYINNDERAALKKRLNLLFGSRLVEEKSYHTA
ncbi:DUF6165 family protein [Roseomonas sp. WA12]